MGGKRWRRVGPVLGVVASTLAMAHAWVPASDGLRVPDGSWGVGITRPAGVTVVLEAGYLVPRDTRSRIELVSVEVTGPGRDPAVGRAEVKVLRLAGNGGIGALTTEDLEVESRAGRGWDLVDPEGVVIDGATGEMWQAVVLITGLADGTWTSDHVEVRYLVDGRPGRQDIPVESTLCVTDLATATCPPETED